ncbi:phage tail protein [Pseudodesulfovibrio pelocollis]|uniref:phage tail protein n=1 Tax=Pseudodesulfovibrio pelocollis TaxID=3051432 RepID=UPI00255A902B|nr:phage tail protein [Pseudodesulfovibrio sp. SB368]
MQKASFEIRGVKPLLDAIQGIEKGQAKVITRALNTTAQGARTDAVTLIRQELNLKAKTVREGLSIERATWSNQEATLVARGKHGVSLMHYAPRPSRPEQRKPSVGVSVQIKKRGTRKAVKGSFVAKMKSGHIGVFKRERGAGRLPIKQLSGVGFIGYLKRGAMQRRLRRRIDERLQKNLLHEVNWLIRSNMQKIGKLS